MDYNAEQLAENYIVLRTTIQQKEAAFEEEIKVLKDEQDAVSAQLLELCNTQNADSIKTAAGTISRRVQSRYWCNDWEEMYKFIEEQKAPFLLERRIHNGNMQEFLADHPNDMPVGLQADRKFVISVRKPSGK